MVSTGKKKPRGKKEAKDKALRIVEILLGHKASRPVVFDVADLCSFTDFMVLVSGRSTRHVQGAAEKLVSELKKAGDKPLGVEGLKEGHWVLVDCLDVLVHIFYETHRDYYDLEGLWADAPRLELAGLVPESLMAEASNIEEKW